MLKADRISTSVPIPRASPDQARANESDASQLATVALFSGVGLLVSLVIIIAEIHSGWF
jgi:hypothetical protein